MQQFVIFDALANGTRRKILEMMLEGPRSAGEIADEFKQSRSTISEHVHYLKAHGLVIEIAEGRSRIFQLNPTPLNELLEWIKPFENYWKERLSALEKTLDEESTMSQENTIVLEQVINHPIQKVWEALSTPALLAKWWAPGDVRAEVGHRFDLDMGEKFGKQPCEVLEVVEYEKFVLSFAPGTLNTTITWTLEAQGEGTKLTLEHKGFDLDSPLGQMAYQGMKNGWPFVLGRIESALS